ncbi:MAG: DNA alkylation repair protein [Bacilli bacterium]|nr:DNA alkylation repair protein [Bacilli bacterium]
MDIKEELIKHRDVDYATFSSKLTPNIDPSLFIGCRVPYLRKLAKEIYNTKEAESFIHSLPHQYVEENLLHGFLLSLNKDYDTCINSIEQFLPYMDNWAVTDTTNPKIFARNKDKLIIKIKEWLSSNHPYIIRFGIMMLMRYYLDTDFKTEYLFLVTNIKSDHYYVKMMQAWYFATALAKQYDNTIRIIESKVLDKWVHNKTIQKAKESFRINGEQKIYLGSLKITY